MSFHYKLLIEYKGTNYLGWQIQPEASGKTIQGELNKVLKLISKSQDVKTMGAGRTDAGVHALGQVVNVTFPLEIHPEKLVLSLNANLPDDIRVLKAEITTPEFIPTIDASSKEYHYRFTCTRSVTAFQREHLANCSFDLDLKLMQEACKVFVGVHDFTNFYCEGTEVSSYVREIFSCEIIYCQESGGILPPHYVFKIVGNGFLKQMVRLMVGAVWSVGRGKISINELKSSLSPYKIKRLGVVAPPEGLYMVCVKY